MKPIRTWIVDDESLARDRLRQLLADEPGFEVVGESASSRAALDDLPRARPELVFLDVRMPEVDGLAVARALGSRERPIVVFVTAFDSHALEAFEVHALDYLLKPFDRERLRRALDQARDQIERERRGDFDERIAALLAPRPAQPTKLRRVAVKTATGVAFIDVEQIDWVEARGNYVRLHAGPHTYVRRETLQHFSERLDARRFVRIHRSTLVNSQRVRAQEPLLHGDAMLVLQDGTRLALSRSYREQAERVFGG